jgi:hypothetical protein
MAPLRLDRPQDVAKRVEQVLDVLERGLMPPWPASALGLPLLDENRVDARARGMLRQWADEGALVDAPTAANDARAARPKFAVAGCDELLFRVPGSWELPAGGPDRMRSFLVPIGLPEERWVRALAVEPTNAAPLHHALLFLDMSGQARKRDGASGEAGFSGMIDLSDTSSIERGGWTPGVVPRALPEGTAWKLPTRSDLVLDVHLVPTGKPEAIELAVRLFLDRAPPQHVIQFVRLAIIGINLRADSRWTGSDTFVVPQDVTLHGAIAHAHKLCRTARAEAVLPDGRRFVVLDIPDWNFAWQMHYRLAQPLRLPVGTRLEARFEYDNTSENPRNPHRPPRRVIGGPLSNDEMGALWFELSVANAPGDSPLLLANSAHVQANSRDLMLQDLRANLLKQFDGDGDGSLDAAEDAGLVRWVRELPPDAPEMRDARTLFDRDKSGALDADEQAEMSRFAAEW